MAGRIKLAMNPRFLPPENETREHFLLKQVALAWLKESGHCTFVGTEVDNLGADAFSPRSVADACGISRKHVGRTIHEREYTVRCVEVKVSKSDLRNGYCTGGDLNYIMAPKGLFTKDDLEPGVGLVEVDIDNLRWTNAGLLGVYLTVKPKRVKRETYWRCGKNRDHWCDLILESVFARLTNDAVYRNPWFYHHFRLVREVEEKPS